MRHPATSVRGWLNKLLDPLKHVLLLRICQSMAHKFGMTFTAFIVIITVINMNGSTANLSRREVLRSAKLRRE